MSARLYKLIPAFCLIFIKQPLPNIMICIKYNIRFQINSSPSPVVCRDGQINSSPLFTFVSRHSPQTRSMANQSVPPKVHSGRLVSLSSWASWTLPVDTDIVREQVSINFPINSNQLIVMKHQVTSSSSYSVVLCWFIASSLSICEGSWHRSMLKYVHLPPNIKSEICQLGPHATPKSWFGPTQPTQPSPTTHIFWGFIWNRKWVSFAREAQGDHIAKMDNVAFLQAIQYQ